MGRASSSLNQAKEPLRFLKLVVTQQSREREETVQAAKMAIAAVLAWIAATWWFELPQAFIAPYAAVFLMSRTVYRSITSAVQQIAAVALGVLLAHLTILLVPNLIAALALAVFVGGVIGVWHRFGPSGIWVSITALLMLTYGTAPQVDYLLPRVLESVLGSLIGVAVNMVLFPPVHLSGASNAIHRLGDEIEQLLHTLAETLRGEWGFDQALPWQRRADSLNKVFGDASDALSRGAESTLFNPRRFLRRGRDLPSPEKHRSALRVLSELSEQLQQLGRILTHASNDGAKPDRRFTDEFAGLLDNLAEAVTAYGGSARQSGEHEAARRLDQAVGTVRRQYDEVARQVRQHELEQQRALSAEGAMLLAIERALRLVSDTSGDNTW